MLIRCPTCASGYELAPALLSEGLVLRCGLCRDAWTHGSSDARSMAGAAPPRGREIVAEARFSRRVPLPAGRRATSRPSGPPAPMGRAASLVACLVVLALTGGGMAAVAGKARVVALFPPSEAVFATLGLPVNLRGLSLGEIRSTVERSGGGSTLTLEGHITNLRTDPTPVPSLRISVRDKSRRELYYWTAPAPKAQLAAGETVLFRSRLSAPPRDGQDLAVSFAEPSAGPRRVAEVLAGDR